MKASIFLITYNHEAYIAKAIESIVSQKTNFDFELVIGEDCSTDNTLAICKQFASQYPNIINLLPSDKNYGPMGNTVRTLNACTGEYIALCEGDDYWTDDHKLQKQVDFLDANPEFSMCFTAVDIIDEIGMNRPYSSYFPTFDKDVFTIEDFIRSGMSIPPTSSTIFRNVLPRPLPAFFTGARAGDMGLQLLVADKGMVKCLPGKTAVYRIHMGGITRSKEYIASADDALMKYYSEFNVYSKYKYDTVFRERFLNNAKADLIFGSRDKKGLSKILHFTKAFPKYLKYSDHINVKEIFYYLSILFFPYILKLRVKKKGLGS